MFFTKDAINSLSLTILVLLFVPTIFGFKPETENNSVVAKESNTVVSPLYIQDAYHGTIKFEMKDGSHITPFGVEVIVKNGDKVVERVSTNNSGEYYLENLETGEYKMTVQHKGSTIYSDSLVITPSTPENLGSTIIDIQNIE
ncbi:carboxypeptidase-like regulatory domain-containing protein [Aliifodinibius sp. S!AR15-10]|uniref:carboxypeptidase-like regulatory domain-containing protein n=1 Tax=Aliifodinibius sp. S!AR15-10 TaxID=2950437 RepID=UPI0028648D27|nr:carboxypeptidase-like regulatory domain-containing protein [Aliifodinibius sp. S!AR15-10]MDR8389615.1 carboxypeptidase-like regulatory domain-containing protein [Aliifodinibius sp. S!AR15-10]